jgi:hypothetical protein
MKGYQVIDFQHSRVQADIYFTGPAEEIVDKLPATKQYQRSYAWKGGKKHLELVTEESSQDDRQ